MISNFDRLSVIAKKNSRMVLGLMSGTSMDGLDLALCRLSGHGLETNFELVEFHTFPHSENYKNNVNSIFARPLAGQSSVAAIHQFVAEVHGKQILKTLDHWGLEPKQVDLIASHGQTVYHNPSFRWSRKEHPHPITTQLGDGDFIAAHTGIITVSDFRQKHIATGGEGAPLALYGDYLLFSNPDKSCVFLNIGGISNFTWLPATTEGFPAVCTDTGPGNTMMDAYMRNTFGAPYDHDGAVGRSGQVSQDLLSALLEDPFFEEPLPRTTGPELFNLEYLDSKLEHTGHTALSPKDIMATLHAFTASSISQCIKPYVTESTPIYVSGGGAHNPLIMEFLADHLPDQIFKTTRDLGINPDAKEAIIFALLANECLFGQPENYQNLGTGYPKTSMGKVSFP